MKVKYITNLIILILITFCFTSFCLHQNIEGTNAFFQVKYPFIYSKPITIKLTKQDIIDYCFDFYNSEHPKKIVDSLFLLEMLSNDKKDIVSFPDVKDVYFKGKLAYPTPLAKGYLLDNRGIGKNVAFLKYTYEEYSKLAETPTKEIMMSMLLETNPLIELYNCNKISSNDIEEINKFIEKGLPGICIDLTK
ncbi:MAG: hypothetical protein WCP65_02435 [Bacteroidota bacterium]